MRTTKLVGLFLALILPLPARAQTDEEAAVRATVDRLFDAMRAADSGGVRAALHPATRLVSITEREGQPVLHVEESMEGFITAVGTPHEETWDERIWDVEVRIDGRLATLWTKYAFYLGDQLSHCGVDAFQLFKGVDGWKIFEIADTRRREGCEPLPTG
jgi:hypothetical protein